MNNITYLSFREAFINAANEYLRNLSVSKMYIDLLNELMEILYKNTISFEEVRKMIETADTNYKQDQTLYNREQLKASKDLFRRLVELDKESLTTLFKMLTGRLSVKYIDDVNE